jgi:hypothetical protein
MSALPEARKRHASEVHTSKHTFPLKYVRPQDLHEEAMTGTDDLETASAAGSEAVVEEDDIAGDDVEEEPVDSCAVIPSYDLHTIPNVIWSHSHIYKPDHPYAKALDIFFCVKAQVQMGDAEHLSKHCVTLEQQLLQARAELQQATLYRDWYDAEHLGFDAHYALERAMTMLHHAVCQWVYKEPRTPPLETDGLSSDAAALALQALMEQLVLSERQVTEEKVAPLPAETLDFSSTGTLLDRQESPQLTQRVCELQLAADEMTDVMCETNTNM